MSRVAATFAALPTRVRVTLTFTAVMAVLLTAAGLFLYGEVGRTLDDTVDRGLHARAADLSAQIQQVDSGLAQAGHSPLTERGESFAQILTPGGQVVDSPPGLRHVQMLTPAQLARAAKHTITIDRASPLSDESDRARLLATPVRAQGRRLIVVVGSSLDTIDEAQRRLGTLLLIGGPIALLIASLAGYGAAAGALRPVEMMRRRAQEIQATRPGRRLPVPRSNDEVARLGETLNEMLERLEIALARERRFVADASHELRTPLAILKAELELALTESGDAASLREAVSSAADEADRVVQLAEDLLVIARSERGQLPIRPAALDATELLTDVTRRFALRADEHGVRLVVDVPEALELHGDRLRLEQALGNLIDNALRHGRGTIALAALRAPAGGGVELHVLDDGDGLAEDFVDRAFDRFTRADAGRTAGGAGLGLAIVRAIATAHGGDAHARNRPEGGADVWMDLPPRPVGAMPTPA